MNIPALQLTQFATDVLTACGMPAADAATTAGCILEADLTGADAHGIFRLPQYTSMPSTKKTSIRAPISERLNRARPRR